MTLAQLRRRRIVRRVFWTLVALLVVALLMTDWFASWPLALIIVAALWVTVIGLFATERRS